MGGGGFQDVPKSHSPEVFVGMEVLINTWEMQVKDWSRPPWQEHLLGLVFVVRVTLILPCVLYSRIHFRVHLE